MIYAEISKKQLGAIEKGTLSFDFPDGTRVNRKHGSRAIYLECDTEEDYKELGAYLDSVYVNWQEMSTTPSLKA